MDDNNKIPKCKAKRTIYFAFLFIILSFNVEIKAEINHFRDPNVNDNVISLIQQPNEKILICGIFTSVGGQSRKGVARLNKDGSLDSSFPNLNPNDTIRSVAIQSDGKILVGGSFNVIGGQNFSRLARLNIDGSIDTSFQDSSIQGAGPTVNVIIPLADGKILIGGGFTTVAGQPRNNIARLNSNGSLDTSFQVSLTLSGGDPFINAITLQPDGKILIGGIFNTVNGEPRRGVARINSDGSLDTSFQDPLVINQGGSGNVRRLILTPTAEIFIIGSYNSVGGQTRNGVTKLSSNGTLDPNFQDQIINNLLTLDIKLQSDGKILVAGGFLTINGQTQTGIGRLNVNGTLDSSFQNPQITGGVGPVYTLAVEANGKILAGGNFTFVGARTRRRVARFDLTGKLEAKPVFIDFDSDEKTDLSIFRPAPGEWWISRSSNGSNFATQFGSSTDKIVPADYTGDGKTDVAFWRPSSGQWFVLRSEDSSFFAFPFGAAGDVPVPADYDGDGKADAAVFRESSLTWFINKSSGGTDIIGFGTAGDKPVVADYDGDGKADIAIYRPNGANGAEWWIRRSSNGSVFATQFGTATDKPVQGDFTGDGKTDIAFFRPSNGNWFILRSEDFSFFAFPFGASGDVPVAGDYDGDGRFDAGVFRPSSNTWFVQRSTAGTLIQQFGIAGDLPTPNAFVP